MVNDVYEYDNGYKRMIVFYDNGCIMKIFYYNKLGELHRDDDKPSFIMFSESGKIYHKYYYKNGVYHRDDNKPACISYSDRKVDSESYWIWGKQHRENGAAVITYYHHTNEISDSLYYLDDVLVTENIVNRRKILRKLKGMS